jgi:hypothetical protein
MPTGGREDVVSGRCRSVRTASCAIYFVANLRAHTLRYTSSRVWPGAISMFPILCRISSRWIRPHASAELSGTMSATYTHAPASWSPRSGQTNSSGDISGHPTYRAANKIPAGRKSPPPPPSALYPWWTSCCPGRLPRSATWTPAGNVRRGRL